MFIARFALGLGIGPKSATVPIYAAECTPPQIRGALVMQWQVRIREHFSSYSGMSQEELLLVVPLETLSPFTFSSNIGSQDMCREQQL
jgi:hypothetical protein